MCDHQISPMKKMKAIVETQRLSEDLEVPVFDMSPLLYSKDEKKISKLCESMGKAMAETSILIVRDPRVSKTDSGNFLDMMERYFSQERELLDKDVRAELHYQVGATPEKTEKAICSTNHKCKEIVDALSKDNKPHLKPDQGADPKWRYFWRIGERPTKSEFAELNAPQVVPETFKDVWQKTMDMWGSKLLHAVTTAAEALAIGYGLKKNAFTDLMNQGPHLLAPTGTDYEKYGNMEEVFATFHQDLNFLTIHGKSRYPGLYIWLRDGTKVPVKMPEGCLLIQAGMQMEHLTGGHVTAGYHEVIATKEAIRRAREAKLDGRIPWRVSSTLFAHINSDRTLIPLGDFNDNKNASKYPAIKAGAQVAEVLKEIALSNSK